MRRSKSCNCRCECCTCPQILESFKVRNGEVHDWTKDWTLCKSVPSLPGYNVNPYCGPSGTTDGEILCNNGCARRWYLVEADTCRVMMEGDITCDGSLVGIDSSGWLFKYLDLDNQYLTVEYDTIAFIDATGTGYGDFGHNQYKNIQGASTKHESAIQFYDVGAIIPPSAVISYAEYAIPLENLSAGDPEGYVWGEHTGIATPLVTGGPSWLNDNIVAVNGYTTASAFFPIAVSGDTYFANVTDIIQELVNLPTWSSTSDVNLFLLNGIAPQYNADWYDPSHTPERPALYIEWGSTALEDFPTIDLIPSGCDLHINDPSGYLFELRSCCYNTLEKSKQIPQATICEETSHSPYCEKCPSSRAIIGNLILHNSGVDENICRWFNYVGATDKLYHDFYHDYQAEDAACTINCHNLGYTYFSDIANNPDRNFRRYWSINEIDNVLYTGEIQRVDGECCPPFTVGEVNQHGELLWTSGSGPDRPATCEYCMDNSYHWYPVGYWSTTGEMFPSGFLTLGDNLFFLPPSGYPKDGGYITEFYPWDLLGNASGIEVGGIIDPVYDPQISGLDWNPDIRVWMPVFSGRIPAGSGTPYYLFELQPWDFYSPDVGNHLQLQYNIQYNDGEFDDDGNHLNDDERYGAYFEMDLTLYSHFYREDLTIRTERICPTVSTLLDIPPDKIDCNHLSRTPISFQEVTSQSHIYYPFGRLVTGSGIPSSVILNYDEVMINFDSPSNPFLFDAINITVQLHPDENPWQKYMDLTRFGIAEDDPDHCGILIDYTDTLASSGATKRLELSVCCCDTKTMVADNLTMSLIPLASGFTTDDLMYCNCSGYNQVDLCAAQVGSYVLIIIDESVSVYSPVDGGDNPFCDCETNFNYIQDLDELRQNAAGIQISIWQPEDPTGYAGERDWCGMSDWQGLLTGGCPLPYEVVEHIPDVPRTNPSDTFSRLQVLFFKTVLNRYSEFHIYLDISGSVVPLHFEPGIDLFISWVLNNFPSVNVIYQKFPDERWLNYAQQRAGQDRCIISDSPICNSGVTINGLTYDPFYDPTL